MPSEFTKIVDKIEDFKEFDNHKFVTLLNNRKAGLEGFIAIHRKNKDVPSFGATRLWFYDSKEQALKDALRLSYLMSYKAALAGLPCGGAKAVILKPEKIKDKKALLEAYAEQLNFLGGQFITGTDVGLTQGDIEYMQQYTDSLVGFTGNPTVATGDGIEKALQACLQYKFNSPEYIDRTFAIQGLGKVGAELLSRLYGKAKTIYVADINEAVISVIQKTYPNITVVKAEDIHKQQVDVFCPCALSNALNSKTINELECQIVCGAANNQLENNDIGDLLHKLGVLYAPDYVVNAGGLIAVYFEHQGASNGTVQEKIDNIEETINNILKESAETNLPTHRIANKRAEAVFNTYE